VLRRRSSSAEEGEDGEGRRKEAQEVIAQDVEAVVVVVTTGGQDCIPDEVRGVLTDAFRAELMGKGVVDGRMPAGPPTTAGETGRLANVTGRVRFLSVVRQVAMQVHRRSRSSALKHI
jgi:hypothetical protein